MTEPADSRRILTLPNLVSVLRLLAVPVFLWLLFDDRVAAAGLMLLAIGWTDWIDGVLARRLDQVSELGKALDPVADRLALAAALVGGWVTGVLPVWLAAALLAREVVVGIGAAALALRRGEKLEVRYLGKLATFLLYGAIPSFYLAAAGVAPAFFEPAGWVSGVIGTGLYYVVGGQYLWEIAGRLRRPGRVRL